MSFKILSKKSEKILKQCIRFNTNIEKIKFHKIIPKLSYKKFIEDVYNSTTNEEITNVNVSICEYYYEKFLLKILNNVTFCSYDQGNKVDKNNRNIYNDDYDWLLYFLYPIEDISNILTNIWNKKSTLEKKTLNANVRNNILNKNQLKFIKKSANNFKELTIFDAFKEWWEKFGSYFNNYIHSKENKEQIINRLELQTSKLCDKWKKFFNKAKLAKIDFICSTNISEESRFKHKIFNHEINFQNLIVKISINLEPHIFNELKNTNYIDDKQTNDKRLDGYIYDKKIYTLTSKITDKYGVENSGFYFLNQINTYFKNKKIAFILPWLSVVLSVLAIIVSIVSIIALIYTK